MANMEYPHDGGHVGFEAGETLRPHRPEPSHTPLATYTNIAGAVMSVALLTAVGVWGYKLVVRDVTGIPVVQASTDEMRVRPADPGGQLALHQGLAVNEVAGTSQAAGPVDRLVLAPEPIDLAEDDLPVTLSAEAPVQQPTPLDVAAALEDNGVDVAAAVEAGEIAAPAAGAPVEEIATARADTRTDALSGALEAGDVEALVAQLTDGAESIEAAPVDEAEATVETALAPVEPEPEIIAEPAVFEGPGLQLSVRPQLRPVQAVVRTVAATPTPAPERTGVNDIDHATLAAGTRLVQLGAFDSPDIAREEWQRLSQRFDQYMTGKDRVVMEARSGGRTFYRLRAHGFTDLADARRFCATLAAQGADCIPVVTR